jgi:hypothetical protein
MPRWLPFWERFDSYFTKGDGCWVWHGPRHDFGYGQICRGRTPFYAHREAYERAFGPIPPGLEVLHSCDNPPCVRPDHLFIGTQAENMADCKRKGRNRGGSLGGERAYQARLTPEQVDKIRLSIRLIGETQNQHHARLARWYGVHRKTIYDVIARRSWRAT